MSTKQHLSYAEICNDMNATSRHDTKIRNMKFQLDRAEDERKAACDRLQTICFHPIVACIVRASTLCLVCGAESVETVPHQHETVHIYVADRATATSLVRNRLVVQAMEERYAPKYGNGWNAEERLKEYARASRLAVFGINATT